MRRWFGRGVSQVLEPRALRRIPFIHWNETKIGQAVLARARHDSFRAKEGAPWRTHTCCKKIRAIPTAFLENIRPRLRVPARKCGDDVKCAAAAFWAEPKTDKPAGVEV